MFSDELRTFLKSKFPDARDASGHTEIAIRCRICGDSQHDMSARHLYISLGTKDAPPMYHCKKCNSSGKLTAEVLRSFVDCSDDGEFLSVLRNKNAKLAKFSNNKIKNRRVYRVYNKFIDDTKLSQAKLYYINKRLGLNLTYTDLMEDKIVLNLLDLLNRNNIKEYTRYPNIVSELNDCFIGFLSMDNGFVNMKNLVYGKRELTKSINIRYVNYSIFQSEDNSRRYYTIPSKCNLCTPQPIDIHIAEGGFDILSIFYNLRGANRIQNIYTSIGGKSYRNLIELYLREFGLMNVRFHIYVDNDIDLEPLMYYIKTALVPLGLEVYIHKNSYPGEKDFGVSLDKIKEEIISV